MTSLPTHRGFQGSRGFQELVLSFQQTERVQVRVGEPSIIGVGCGGVPLPPNN